MSSALDIVRIMCVKIEKYGSLPKWRFISRKNLSIRIFKLYREFLSYDIYEKTSIISTMLISFYNSTPELFSESLLKTINVRQAAIQIKFSEEDGYGLNGDVIYTPKTSEFIISTNSKKDYIGEVFTISKDMQTIPKHNLDTFSKVADILDNIYFYLILSISYMINYPTNLDKQKNPIGN